MRIKTAPSQPAVLENARLLASIAMPLAAWSQEAGQQQVQLHLADRQRQPYRDTVGVPGQMLDLLVGRRKASEEQSTALRTAGENMLHNSFAEADQIVRRLIRRSVDLETPALDG